MNGIGTIIGIPFKQKFYAFYGNCSIRVEIALQEKTRAKVLEAS